MMFAWGAGLLVVGVLVVLGSFSMDTSVYSSPTFVAGEAIGGGSTYNLGLLQQQMMTLHTGLAMAIAGAIFMSRSVPKAEAEIVEPTPSVRDRREGETDEEYESRVAGVALTNRIVGFSLLGLLAIGVIAMAVG